MRPSGEGGNLRNLLFNTFLILGMVGCSDEGGGLQPDASADSGGHVDSGTDMQTGGDAAPDVAADAASDANGNGGSDADMEVRTDADMVTAGDIGTDSGSTAACEYGGNGYEEGESFWATDACNTCACSSGEVGCTKVFCPCTGDEWFRDYVAKDPATCANTTFECPQNTVPFSNDCGCGCEQSPACEMVYDCKPPTDCSEDQERCPYSTFAL